MTKQHPLYYQIYADLRNKLADGLFSPGDQVPTEAELEKQYSVSRITSKRALSLLADDGFIERIPGRGSFVRPKHHWPGHTGASDLELPQPRKTIGFVTQGIGASYGTQLVIGVEKATSRAGLSLLVRFTAGNQKTEEAAIREMIAQGCTGLILFPVNGELYSPSLLHAYLSGLPVVLIDRYFPGLDIPSVSSDNAAAAVVGVNYLLDLGHENILLLSPPSQNTVSIEERINGFVDAFTKRNLAIDHNLILSDLTTCLPDTPQQDSYSHDAHRIAELLAQRPEITAMMALEYNLAVAAAHAAEKTGRRVPQDVSIMCFDHPSGSNASQPCFTHLRQDEKRMGQLAVQQLLHMADVQSESKRADRIHLPVDLIVGPTTAPVDLPAAVQNTRQSG